MQCFSDLDFGRNKYDERIVKEVIGLIYLTYICAYYSLKSIRLFVERKTKQKMDFE